ncbi:MAG: nucleotide excision repair endonuclease [Verrucomicrobiota bacterium]
MSRSLALNDGVPAVQTMLFPDPRPLVERLGSDFFRQLPERPGVYLMQDAAGLVLYVGKAKNLRQRLTSYRVANPDRLGRRHLRLLRQVMKIELQECPDEAAALAKESELLRALKPKFNRAGVWPGNPRHLVWRLVGAKLELAISKTPTDGWQAFGPFGSGVVYLRASLVRLLWYALNPAAGSIAMPAGWLHGRLGAIASIAIPPTQDSSVELVLSKLVEGDADGVVAWIGERTTSLVRAYDLEIRDADLEAVVEFMKAKARRPAPFATPDQLPVLPSRGPAFLLPFLEEAGNES